MHLYTVLLLSALLSLILATPSLSDQTYCPSVPAHPKKQSAIFDEFLRILLTDRNVVEAYSRFIDVDLIEHSPFGVQGRDANAAFLTPILPSANFSVLRKNFDNDLGIVHSRVEGQPQPSALVNIYRFNGTCIVEHWDITELRPANATNPVALF